MSTTTAKLGSKSDLWMMSAADLIVIGLDTDDGPEHPLWRADVRDPIDAGIAPSIRKHGVLTPIRARRSKADPSKAEVVMGRGRVAGVRQIHAEDGTEIKVPVMIFPAGATVAEIIGAANAENHVRKVESVLTTMEHAWMQLKAEGGLETKGALKQVATDLGIGEGKVRALIKLRACPDVVAALRDGKIAESTAITLASLPDEARERELMDAITNPGATPNVAEMRKRAVRARATAKGAAKSEADVATTLDMKTLKALAAMGDESPLGPEVVAFLHVVVGARAPATVKGLTAALRKLGVIRD